MLKVQLIENYGDPGERAWRHRHVWFRKLIHSQWITTLTIPLAEHTVPLRHLTH